MTRETKVGIAMVLLLVGVFGFLVYKRFTRPLDAMAQNETPAVEDLADAAEEEDAPALKSAEEFGADDNQQEPSIIPVAGSSREIPAEEPEEIDDPFGGPAEVAPAATAASSRPKLPMMVTEEESSDRGEEEFSFPSDTEGGGATVRNDEPDLDANDPFIDSATSESTATEAVSSSPPVIEFESKETPDADDPFISEPEPTASQAPDIAVREPEFEEPNTVSVQARTVLPEKSLDFGEEAVDEPAQELMTNPSPAPVRSPTPQLMLDDSDEDRYGGYEPIELVDGVADAGFTPRAASQTDFFDVESETRSTPATIAGDSHVVQPGENFWSISQKKYGTGRFFQALAAHNRQSIPDPTKMKPGVTVSLPSEEELERNYANLIPNGGPSEPGAAGGQVNQAGEFLVDREGHPMYRIGSRDTLSEISQKYLGRSSRWMQIFEMNRDVLKDGNTLKVGALLRLPSDAGELQLSNQPRVFR